MFIRYIIVEPRPKSSSDQSSTVRPKGHSNCAWIMTLKLVFHHHPPKHFLLFKLVVRLWCQNNSPVYSLSWLMLTVRCKQRTPTLNLCYLSLWENLSWNETLPDWNESLPDWNGFIPGWNEFIPGYF